MTPRDLIRRTASRFRDAGIPDPETDSALLLSALCGRPPLDLRLDTDTNLNEALLSRYENLVRQRLRRVPLQYILGETSFFGLRFFVDYRVLIPRPETELLCEWALDRMRSFSAPRVLDLCCGSGCVGLSVKRSRPDAVVTLSDMSPDALEIAKINARQLNLDVAFSRADLLDGFAPRSFDVILCNPPYIPSVSCADLQPEVLFEPLSALDGGADGLSFYRRLIPAASLVLSAGGMLFLECGIGESAAVASLLSGSGFHDITVRKDLAEIDRMVSAVNP